MIKSRDTKLKMPTKRTLTVYSEKNFLPTSQTPEVLMPTSSSTIKTVMK